MRVQRERDARVRHGERIEVAVALGVHLDVLLDEAGEREHRGGDEEERPHHEQQRAAGGDRARSARLHCA